jgi:hypothetical protein
LATASEKFEKDKAALEAEVEQLNLAASVASLSPQGSSQDVVATGEVHQPDQPPTSAQDEAMDVFRQLDQSGSGSLTQAEMKKVLQKDKPLRAKLGARSWSKFFGELGCAGGLPPCCLILLFDTDCMSCACFAWCRQLICGLGGMQMAEQSLQRCL